MAQWVGCCLINGKFAGWVPSPSTCLGCQPGPQLGAHERQLIDVSLTHWGFSPPFFLPFPLSKYKSIFLNKLKLKNKLRDKMTSGPFHEWSTNVCYPSLCKLPNTFIFYCPVSHDIISCAYMIYLMTRLLGLLFQGKLESNSWFLCEIIPYYSSLLIHSIRVYWATTVCQALLSLSFYRHSGHMFTCSLSKQLNS